MTNPIRDCPLCDQEDDHPRHVVAMMGDVEVYFHMDCHARAMNCGLCASQISGVTEGTVGDALRAHLTSMPMEVQS